MTFSNDFKYCTLYFHSIKYLNIVFKYYILNFIFSPFIQRGTDCVHCPLLYCFYKTRWIYYTTQYNFIFFRNNITKRDLPHQPRVLLGISCILLHPICTFNYAQKSTWRSDHRLGEWTSIRSRLECHAIAYSRNLFLFSRVASPRRDAINRRPKIVLINLRAAYAGCVATLSRIRSFNRAKWARAGRVLLDLTRPGRFNSTTGATTPPFTFLA